MEARARVTDAAALRRGGLLCRPGRVQPAELRVRIRTRLANNATTHPTHPSHPSHPAPPPHQTLSVGMVCAARAVALPASLYLNSCALPGAATLRRAASLLNAGSSA